MHMTDTPEEMVVIDLPDPALDPAVVYAKLRSYTPGRASFLLESRDHAAPAGRYSLVGYRVRSGEMMPPGVDAIAAQVDGLGPAGPSSATVEAFARASMGYFSYGNTHRIHGIRGWEDESVSGYFLNGATVVVFDHHERRVCVVGRKAGRLAERCVWELEHGPEPQPLGAPQPLARPESLRAALDDEQLAARVARAKRYLFAPLETLVLAQGYSTPVGAADPFDAYWALRALSRAPALFFVDFGASPITPPLQLLGAASRPAVVLRASDGPACSGDALQESLRAAFPSEAVVGANRIDAARAVRRLEDTSREHFGALLGYLCPGGAGCFALVERVISARGGLFELSVPVPMRADTDPVAVADATRAAAAAELAAIRAAHDAARAPKPEPPAE